MYLLLASVCGILFGGLSAYYNKAAYGLLMSCLGIAVIVIRPVVVVGASASAANGHSNPIGVYLEGYAMLPDNLKAALFTFFSCFFIGLIVNSILKKAYRSPVEPKDVRQAKIKEMYKDYDWGS